MAEAQAKNKDKINALEKEAEKIIKKKEED